MIEFCFDGVPVAKGRPEFSTIFSNELISGLFDVVRAPDPTWRCVREFLQREVVVTARTPKKTEAAELAVRCSSSHYRKHKPMEGAIGVTTIFVMPPPQKFPPDRSHDWPHIKPDDDNLRKLVLDALKGMFWRDDGQVCGGESWKVYGGRPRTFVRIWQLGRVDLERVREMIGEPSVQPALFGG